MADTYSDCYLRIIDELDASGETSVTARVQLEILSAIRHYNMDQFWFEEAQATASTVASTATIAVPTDLVAIQSLDITYNSHPYPLDRRSWDWYEERAGSDTARTSVPTDYVYYRDQLYLYPIPNGVYTLTMAYTKVLSALSGATDTNAFLSTGEEMIRARARASYRINYKSSEEARQEMLAFSPLGYYAAAEKIAHTKFLGYSNAKVATGRIRPVEF
jgi:hypothetical protein